VITDGLNIPDAKIKSSYMWKVLWEVKKLRCITSTGTVSKVSG